MNRVPYDKTCMISGHRRLNNPNAVRKWLRQELMNAIAEGYTHFVSGAALGADTIFAQELLDLQDQLTNPIYLILVQPYEDQAKFWNPNDQETLRHLLLKADECIVVSSNPTSKKDAGYKLMKRNDRMLSMAKRVLMVWSQNRFGGTYNVYRKVRNNPGHELIQCPHC